jgi:hypothetical protein
MVSSELDATAVDIAVGSCKLSNADWKLATLLFNVPKSLMSVVLLAILSFSAVIGLFSVAINCETILATSILAVPELVLEDVEEIAIKAYLKNAFLKTNCIIKKAIFMPT